MAPSSLFPRDDAEFYARFQDELACLRFLEAIRWPDGFVCPGCGCRDAWLMGTGHRRCVSCRRRTSVTAGTIFAGSRTPLAVWFQAAWKMTSSKGGISAFELHRMLGVSVQTAWTMLHKYRRAMIRPHRELLSERVQVDEAYVGAPEKGTRGRGVRQKAIVAIAVEVRGKGCGRVRMQRVASLTSENLLGFIEETVAPGWVDDRAQLKHLDRHRTRTPRLLAISTSPDSSSAAGASPESAHPRRGNRRPMGLNPRDLAFRADD